MLHGGRGGGVGGAALAVEVPAEHGVVAAGDALPELQAPRALLAPAEDAAVAAGGVGEAVLGAHLAAVGAGVDALAAGDHGQQRVQRAAGAARRRAPVHHLRHPPERDARAPARHAACRLMSINYRSELISVHDMI